MAISPPEYEVFVALGSKVTSSAMAHLVASGVWVQHPNLGDVFHTRCNGARLRELCLAWQPSLGAGDAEQIRCHITPPHHVPTPGQLMHSRDLRWLIDWLNGRWLHDLLQANRLVTFFQPIVEVSRRSRVFAFECLSRAVSLDGTLIPPQELFGAARATDQLASLDLEAQLTAVRTAAELNLDTCIFINFAPKFVDADASTLKRTIAAARSAGLAPEKLVFEVVESDKLHDFQRLSRILTLCRDAGCRVALDDVGAGYNSLSLMAETRPDFIKIDRELIRGVDHDMFKCRVVAKLIELARELEIRTVVEGIESEAEWEWTVNQGAEYAQGYLLGKPSPRPPQKTSEEFDTAPSVGMALVEAPRSLESLGIEELSE